MMLSTLAQSQAHATAGLPCRRAVLPAQRAPASAAMGSYRFAFDRSRRNPRFNKGTPNASCRPGSGTGSFYWGSPGFRGSGSLSMADMLRWWEKAGSPTTLEEFVRLWEKFEKAASNGTPVDSASRPTSSSSTATPQEDNASSLSLPVDSEQTEDTYIYTADVPGLDRTDIKVRVNSERQLTISGERKHADRSPSPDNIKDYSDYTGQARDSTAQRGQRFERRFGRFSRSLTLPRDADVKSISASVERGVLTLTVKKLEKDPDVTDIPIY